MSLALLALLLGCGGSETVTVLAASSLSDAFSDLELAFEAQHPGVDVAVSYAGSQALATQVRHGIRADVFASADVEHARALAAEGSLVEPRPFAHNRLVLATVGGVDLERLPEVERLVVGTPEAPIGRYTVQLLDAAEARYGSPWRAGVEARIASREPNARLVAAKVELGEVDAAIVYRTDLPSDSRARAVALPRDLAPRAVYVHGALTGASEYAEAWLELVESAEGRAILTARGFEP